MNKLVIFMFLFCMFLIDAALAATIHGTVYDFSLNPVEKGIVEVDSTADGYAAQENITIINDGEYSLDLFLFPVMDEDLAIDLNIDTGYGKRDYSSYAYVLLAIIAVIAAATALPSFES